MADQKEESREAGVKQTTPKGTTIPLPSRKDVMDAFKKIVQPRKG